MAHLPPEVIVIDWEQSLLGWPRCSFTFQLTTRFFSNQVAKGLTLNIA